MVLQHWICYILGISLSASVRRNSVKSSLQNTHYYAGLLVTVTLLYMKICNSRLLLVFFTETVVSLSLRSRSGSWSLCCVRQAAGRG